MLCVGIAVWFWLRSMSIPCLNDCYYYCYYMCMSIWVVFNSNDAQTANIHNRTYRWWTNFKKFFFSCICFIGFCLLSSKIKRNYHIVQYEIGIETIAARFYCGLYFLEIWQSCLYVYPTNTGINRSSTYSSKESRYFFNFALWTKLTSKYYSVHGFFFHEVCM